MDVEIKNRLVIKDDSHLDDVHHEDKLAIKYTDV
jgi:hypothetical protein